ncbi:MAG: hypothetical protein HYZ57_21525 [Acidobacteria bacterium]|nr:hypothetical protein [Acidobacteriota bacterium]MBI3282407.1 hypothetical protein [Acidobacteriota bacterium]
MDNLDALKPEIESYLEKNGFIIFRGCSRRADDLTAMEWDTRRYPDYQQFLAVARHLSVKLIALHHHEFSAPMLDDVFDDLQDYGYDEDGAIARRLQELRVYEGFTCLIELSFEYERTLYLFLATTDWYDEFEDIRAEITVGGEPAEEDDDGPLGGYYSKN